MEEIEAHGFSYPIKTYKVIDERSKVHPHEKRVNSRLDGFELNLDAKLLDHTNKDKVESILQEALRILHERD